MGSTSWRNALLGNANQNHSDIPLHPLGELLSKTKITIVGEDVEKLESL